MKHEFCLDISNDTYNLGDLNLFLLNKDAIKYPPMDLEHPEKPFFSGEISQSVEINGEVRNNIVYIPKQFPISGAGLFIFPDNNVGCEEFLTSSNWIEIAEEKKLSLIIMEARSGGWDKKDIQSEVEYAEKVFKLALSRVYYSLNESTYYAIGFSAGAYIATAYSLLNSTLFSGFAVDGDYKLDSRLMKQLGTIHSDRDNAKSKLDVVLPAWLINRESDAKDEIFECLMKSCDAEDRGLVNQYALVYQQDLKKYQNSADGLPMAEIWFSGKSKIAGVSKEEIHRKMVAFLMRFKRWLGIGNGDFRPARNYTDMDLKRFQAKIDGLQREWYVYEPTVYKADPKKKLPIVLAIHGYSATAKLFAENSEWHIMAEKRGFLVVYISAYPSNLNSRGCTVPLPTWNAVAMHAETDDVHYVTAVMNEIKSKYPVDNERIYVSGHSNGSLFTQTLMACMPKEFAAFGPVGAQYHIKLGGKPINSDKDISKDGIVRPVWLLMGHGDIGDADNMKPGSANDKFIEMMCNVNGLSRENAKYIENGNYHTYTFLDDNHVPLLKFTGVQNLPHAYTPEMTHILWDEFFCHFRRKADGSIEYIE